MSDPNNQKPGAYAPAVEIVNLNPMDILNPKQLEVYLSDATEILYGGAAGSGKSFLMRYMAVISCLLVPGLQVYLFRKTSRDLEKNHFVGAWCLPQMVGPLEKNGEAKVMWTPHNLGVKFANGSRIHLAHCQHNKDVYDYQGTDINMLLIDELTHFPDEVYKYLRSRVRIGSLEIPAEYKHLFPRIICGTNPGNVGHNWVKAMFVDAAPPNQVWQAPEEDGGFLRQFIPARLQDNHVMMDNDPDYASRLKGVKDPATAKALLEGDWDIVAGGALDDVWNRDVHVIRPFDIPRSWYVDRAFDWGSSKPYAALWFGESNGEEVTLQDGTTTSFAPGTLFIFKELYGCKPGQVNEGVKELAVDVAKRIKEIDESIKTKRPQGLHPGMKYPVRYVRPGPADSSIFNTENGNCIADDMKKAGIRWRKANKSPGSRKNGLELLRTRLKSSMFDKEQPGIYIFENCVHTIRTLPILPRSEKDPDDVDTMAEDHIYDAVRYKLLQRKSSTKVQEI